MSLTVGPVTAPSVPSPHSAGSGGAAEAASGAALDQKKSTLTALVHKYTATLAHDASSPTLQGLARQIAAAAEELGQIVTLPQVLSRAGVQSVTNLPGTGNVDLRA